MNKILVLFLLSFSITINAQDMTDWQIGINLDLFHFTRINPEFPYVKDKQDIPNGFGFGLTLEKNLNQHWGVKTGFEFTKQNERYYFDKNSSDNENIQSTFEYYNIPLTIQYYHPLNEKLFLIVNLGLQVSFLNYYKTVEEGNYGRRTLASDYGEYISYNNPSLSSLKYGDFRYVMHKRTLFGIIGSIGIKGFLSERISYSTSLMYEYDINSADNLLYYTPTPESAKPELVTHNLRLGMDLGLQYHFSIGNKSCKCSYKK